MPEAGVGDEGHVVEVELLAAVDLEVIEAVAEDVSPRPGVVSVEALGLDRVVVVDPEVPVRAPGGVAGAAISATT